MVYLFLFSSFCNARCARVLVPIRLVLSADFPSFLRSQVTNVVPTLILTLVLITFLSTPSIDLGSKIQLFLEIFFFFVLNWHFFLRIWENLKLLPRPKFEAHWRKNIALSLREPGRPGLEARCVAGWGSAEVGLYAGFGSLNVTALQAGISRWKETAALQRANDAQLPSKLGTIYYHLQLFSSLKRKYSFYFLTHLTWLIHTSFFPSKWNL